MVELEEGGVSAAPQLVGHLQLLLPTQVGINIKQSSLWSAIFITSFLHRLESISSSPGEEEPLAEWEAGG